MCNHILCSSIGDSHRGSMSRKRRIRAMCGSQVLKLPNPIKLPGMIKGSQGKARELKVIFHHLPKMEDCLKFVTFESSNRISSFQFSLFLYFLLQCELQMTIYLDPCHRHINPEKQYNVKFQIGIIFFIRWDIEKKY